MSPRSIYLQEQADKCEWHAKNISGTETQAELRKLAAKYIEQAAEIESKEKTLIPNGSPLGASYG